MNTALALLILVLVAVVALVLLLLLRSWSRRPHSLVHQGRGGYYDLPGPNARLQEIRRVAVEDVAEVQEDDRFFAPDAPGHEEDDL